MTGNDLIASALRLCGVLAAGESADADMGPDCLVVLNQLIDSWNAERLAIYSIASTIFTPAALKQVYQVGVGGDFNIPRPPRIDRYSVISLQNAAEPLELPLDSLTEAEWQGIPVKNISSNLPRCVYNDNAYPLMNLNLWPIPSQQVQFALYFWNQLTQWPTLATDQQFPPGYLRGIRYNLAVDLAAEFGGDPTQMPLVMKIAQESKAMIKSLNIRIPLLGCDPAMVGDGKGQYNWLTDQPAGR
jgi:hypothetical protein